MPNINITTIGGNLTRDPELRVTPRGQVQWFGAWRTYALFPLPGTIFEPTCLRDVADFIRARMEARRNAARQLSEPS